MPDPDRIVPVRAVPVRIVTVTYNSADVIGQMLDSVPDGVEVVVVDNASRDDTCQIVTARGVTLIALEQNVGFGAACNIGAEGNARDYVFFVNPDAVLDEGCCEALVQAGQAHPDLGACNPAIREPDGEIGLKRRSNLLARADWTPRRFAKPGISQEVKILTGAALFCRHAAFAQVGGFDPRIFLYHEDDELCFRLRLAGWRLRLEHAATASHIGSGSTGYSKASVQAKSYAIAQSRIYVEQKYDFAFAHAKAGLRALGKLASPLSVLSPRKRGQAVGYLKGVLAYRRGGYNRAGLAQTAFQAGASEG